MRQKKNDLYIDQQFHGKSALQQNKIEIIQRKLLRKDLILTFFSPYSLISTHQTLSSFLQSPLSSFQRLTQQLFFFFFFTSFFRLMYAQSYFFFCSLKFHRSYCSYDLIDCFILIFVLSSLTFLMIGYYKKTSFSLMFQILSLGSFFFHIRILSNCQFIIFNCRIFSFSQIKYALLVHILVNFVYRRLQSECNCPLSQGQEPTYQKKY